MLLLYINSGWIGMIKPQRTLLTPSQITQRWIQDDAKGFDINPSTSVT